MRLSDVFGNNQIANQQRILNGAEQIRESAPGEQAVNIKDLTPGQILRGELVSNGQGEVLIKLANDAMLNAKLDQNILLELGKMMNFQVRSNGKALTLTPLQANLSMEGPVSKALEMANLPVNSATGELAGKLMQAGLPIDKNHLQQFYKEMIQNPTGQISDLVDLHRLGLPVTEENLNQMSAYKNLTHQLLSGLEQTSSELLQVVSDLSGQGEPLQAASLLRDMLSVLQENTETAPMTEGANEDPTKNTVASPQGDGVGKTMVFQEEGFAKGANVLEGVKNDPSMLTKMTILEDETFGKSVSREPLQEEGLPETVERFLKNEANSDQEKLDLVSHLLKQSISSQNKELAKSVLESESIKKLISDQFSKQWTISPEKVQDAKEIEHFYGRLTRQLKGISSALEQVGQSQSNAYQSCVNLNQNIDFLNQINHMYSYVQLPLKLQQGEAHGDLYVYTNKKNLASKEGPITALLHLDMDNLGPLDVYVSMQDQKVGTKFTVQDDETLDFLEAHMELLTQRLEKRGYQISVQTGIKKEDAPERTSGIGPILENASPGLLIQARGFDVRT